MEASEHHQHSMGCTVDKCMLAGGCMGKYGIVADNKVAGMGKAAAAVDVDDDRTKLARKTQHYCDPLPLNLREIVIVLDRSYPACMSPAPLPLPSFFSFPIRLLIEDTDR